jgi:hypothetical protein
MAKTPMREKPATSTRRIWLRFNIAGLLVLIMFCGLAFAALKQSTDLWQSAVFSLTCFVLVTAALLAILRGGSRRHFWLGFLLFGGCYLAFSLIPPIESRLLSSKGFTLVQSLIYQQVPATYDIVFATDGSVVRTQPEQVKSLDVYATDVQFADVTHGNLNFWNASTGKFLGSWGGSPENFTSIGHSLLALLLGWSGGLLSRWFGRAASAAAKSRIEPD